MSMTDNDELRDRIMELEALVKDMIVTLNSYSALLAINLDAENTKKCNAIVDEYNERMKELGIEVDARSELEPKTNLLEPCPFCGGEADEYEGDYGNGVYCMMCGAMVGEPIHLDYRVTERVTMEQAIEAWNTREKLESKRDATRSTVNAVRHHYGAGPTSMTDEQIDAASEVYGRKLDYDFVIADELNATLGSGTCHIVERNGDWYCDACGDMVGTCDPASELFIDGNAVKLWNYCPNCGARVEKVDA